MPHSALTIARLLPAADPAPPDVPLLRTFVATGSAAGEVAFEELVRRHGPMVLSTCRRVLGNSHDAEDAFQATFLVLARKAATIRGNLAGWLYAVAVRTARGVRVMRDRRRRHELAGGGRHHAVASNGSDPELASILDEEIAKLPALYREAVVFCELRGLSRKDAARELGIPEGTLSSRLAGAKKRLAALLSARGMTASAVLVSLNTSTAVSAALVRSAVLATRGASNAVASAAASAVVKGMLFEQLRVVVFAAGVFLTAVCGGWAMSETAGGDQPVGAPAPRAVDEPTAKVIAKLGAPDFADREAAVRRLCEIGPAAKPALRMALRSDDPEVRDRAARALAVIRKEQLRAVFARIAGDDRAARDLFAKLVSSPRGADALDRVLDDPSRADDEYRTRTAELLRVAGGHPAVGPDGKADVPTGLDVHAAPAVPLGDVAGWMLLGALQPGTAKWREITHDGWQNRLSSHIPFLPEDDYTSAQSIAAAFEGRDAAPLKKLTAVWLAKRRENDGLRAGLALAVRYDLTDAVPAVRRVLSDPKPTEVSSWNLAAAAILVALHGTKDDLPLLARHASDDRNYSTFLNLPQDFDWVGAIPSEEGRDTFCHVRDAAVVSMCKLAGKNPQDFGFPPFPATKHPNGRPMSLSSATMVGFKSKAVRNAAFVKAKAFLDEQKPAPKKEDPKPDPAVPRLVDQLGAPEFADREAAAKALRELGTKAESTLKAGLASENAEVVKRCRELLDQVSRDGLIARHWPRFSKIIGDDAASRELFDRIRSLKRNVELLDAVAADPASAGKLYHDRWKELNEANRTPNGPGGFILSAAPLADVVGWMYLGTFPGAEGSHHQSSSLDFLPVSFHSTSRDPLPIALKDREASAALRRLVGRWTAARTDYVGRDFGLQLALAFDIAEVLPAARETLTAKVKKDPYPGNTARNVGFAMLVIGKLGTKDDLLLLEQYAKDETQCARFLHDPPPKPGQPAFRIIRPPIEGQDTTTQLRDIAVAMRLHRLGQKPEEFGFHWSWPYGEDAGKPNKLGTFHLHATGFLRNSDREAAHKKAREWLDKQKE